MLTHCWVCSEMKCAEAVIPWTSVIKCTGNVKKCFFHYATHTLHFLQHMKRVQPKSEACILDCVLSVYSFLRLRGENSWSVVEHISMTLQFTELPQFFLQINYQAVQKMSLTHPNVIDVKQRINLCSHGFCTEGNHFLSLTEHSRQLWVSFHWSCWMTGGF